ncbi:hypothetical protein [Paraburkholderia phytofirmans]|uniref:hypothetical protein n=1 Tax=Paraburkholderia phytofirmans TaxID=261302 RepID=UPI0038BABE37
MTQSDEVSRAAVERTAADRSARRHAADAADAGHYAALMARQRERFTAAFGRCKDAERSEIARWISKGAALLEADARHTPSRAKVAVDMMKKAVFMLDPKAPA